MTNAHVVAAAHEPSPALQQRLAERAGRPGCSTRDVVLHPTIFAVLPNGTKLPAVVARSGLSMRSEMSGEDLALLRIEARDLPTLALGDSRSAKVGDRLHVIGFPAVVLTHQLLNAAATPEASITSGSISGFPRDRAGQPVIQIDASATWGTSGGPVIDQQGRVLGVVTFVADDADETGGPVQGFNFVIPVEALRAFLAGSDVPLDAPSRFNAAWHAALRSFFSGHHRAAVEPLAEAGRLVPGLPDVMRIAAENDERLNHPPPRPFPWAAAALGLTLVGVAASVGWFFARWRRNRFRIRAAEVLRMVEAGQPPVILDVRDDVTYGRSPFVIPNAVHVSPEALASGSAELPADRTRTVVAYCT